MCIYFGSSVLTNNGHSDITAGSALVLKISMEKNRSRLISLEKKEALLKYFNPVLSCFLVFGEAKRFNRLIVLVWHIACSTSSEITIESA